MKNLRASKRPRSVRNGIMDNLPTTLAGSIDAARLVDWVSQKYLSTMWKTILTIATILILGIIMFNIFNKSNTEKKSGMSIDISTAEFKEKRVETKGVIIDVRTQAEYDQGHLAETDHQYDMMTGEFQSQLENLDKEETYYLYCRTGNRSGQAARIMKNAGFENVYNVGGFEDLANAGFETK